ncbi:MAG: hypothetical protein ABTR07_18670 [Candidatus Competibacter denitrificans]
MSVNGLTLEQLSYQQRETLKGLRAIGGSAKRLDVAKASGIDGTKVAASLTRLEMFEFVAKGEDQHWRITAKGQVLLGEAEPITARATAHEEPSSQPTQPATSLQTEMQSEIRRLRKHKEPPFSISDAAWLCQTLASELHDMPSISDLLGQMANYWRAAQ